MCHTDKSAKKKVPWWTRVFSLFVTGANSNILSAQGGGQALKDNTWALSPQEETGRFRSSDRSVYFRRERKWKRGKGREGVKCGLRMLSQSFTCFDVGDKILP